MMVLTLKSNKHILVVPHDVGDVEEHRKQLENDFASCNGKTKFQAIVSDCGQVGSPAERFSTVCNCPFDCHSGWTLDVAEIILINEDSYNQLAHLAGGESKWIK